MNFDVPIDEKQQRALFYYFVEAEIYPTTKPLVLLLDGGLFLLIFIICLVVEKMQEWGKGMGLCHVFQFLGSRDNTLYSFEPAEIIFYLVGLSFW